MPCFSPNSSATGDGLRLPRNQKGLLEQGTDGVAKVGSQGRALLRRPQVAYASYEQIVTESSIRNIAGKRRGRNGRERRKNERIGSCLKNQEPTRLLAKTKVSVTLVVIRYLQQRRAQAFSLC